MDSLRRLVHKSSIYRKLRWSISRKTPTSIQGKVLLHVGCGAVNAPCFINIDTRLYPHVHYQRSITSPQLWKLEDADLIYASHVLEHVNFSEVQPVLNRLYSMLKKGGTLRLSVPDFDSLLNIYRLSGDDIGVIHAPLMGHQDHPFNFHFTVFNSQSLTAALRNAGFGEVRKWDPENCQYHDFDDWANRVFDINGQTVPVSLNLEAIKD